MKSDCSQSIAPWPKKRRQRDPKRSDDGKVLPEPVPINASPSYFFTGSWVTRLMVPPSALGPSSGVE